MRITDEGKTILLQSIANSLNKLVLMDNHTPICESTIVATNDNGVLKITGQGVIKQNGTITKAVLYHTNIAVIELDVGTEFIVDTPVVIQGGIINIDEFVLTI